MRKDRLVIVSLANLFIFSAFVQAQTTDADKLKNDAMLSIVKASYEIKLFAKAGNPDYFRKSLNAIRSFGQNGLELQKMKDQTISELGRKVSEKSAELEKFVDGMVRDNEESLKAREKVGKKLDGYLEVVNSLRESQMKKLSEYIGAEGEKNQQESARLTEYLKRVSLCTDLLSMGSYIRIKSLTVIDNSRVESEIMKRFESIVKTLDDIKAICVKEEDLKAIEKIHSLFKDVRAAVDEEIKKTLIVDVSAEKMVSTCEMLLIEISGKQTASAPSSGR